MRLGKHALAWALCSAAAFGLSTLAKADDFYKGKNIKLIIGSGEASGVDILGRVAARHLSNHIPGKPTIIVQNMAAPESIAAANYVYNIAEPDGLTIGSGSSGLFSRAISQPNVRFDLSKSPGSPTSIARRWSSGCARIFPARPSRRSAAVRRH